MSAVQLPPLWPAARPAPPTPPTEPPGATRPSARAAEALPADSGVRTPAPPDGAPPASRPRKQSTDQKRRRVPTHVERDETEARRGLEETSDWVRSGAQRSYWQVVELAAEAARKSVVQDEAEERDRVDADETDSYVRSVTENWRTVLSIEEHRLRRTIDADAGWGHREALALMTLSHRSISAAAIQRGAQGMLTRRRYRLARPWLRFRRMDRIVAPAVRDRVEAAGSHGLSLLASVESLHRVAAACMSARRECIELESTTRVHLVVGVVMPVRMVHKLHVEEETARQDRRSEELDSRRCVVSAQHTGSAAILRSAEERAFGSIVVDANWRGFLASRGSHLTHRASVLIQTWFRRCIAGDCGRSATLQQIRRDLEGMPRARRRLSSAGAEAHLARVRALRTEYEVEWVDLVRSGEEMDKRRVSDAESSRRDVLSRDENWAWQSAMRSAVLLTLETHFFQRRDVCCSEEDAREAFYALESRAYTGLLLRQGDSDLAATETCRRRALVEQQADGLGAFADEEETGRMTAAALSIQRIARGRLARRRRAELVERRRTAAELQRLAEARAIAELRERFHLGDMEENGRLRIRGRWASPWMRWLRQTRDKVGELFAQIAHDRMATVMALSTAADALFVVTWTKEAEERDRFPAIFKAGLQAALRLSNQRETVSRADLVMEEASARSALSAPAPAVVLSDECAAAAIRLAGWWRRVRAGEVGRAATRRWLRQELRKQRTGQKPPVSSRATAEAARRKLDSEERSGRELQRDRLQAAEGRARSVLVADRTAAEDRLHRQWMLSVSASFSSRRAALHAAELDGRARTHADVSEERSDLQASALWRLVEGDLNARCAQRAWRSFCARRRVAQLREFARQRASLQKRESKFREGYKTAEQMRHSALTALARPQVEELSARKEVDGRRRQEWFDEWLAPAESIQRDGQQQDMVTGWVEIVRLHAVEIRKFGVEFAIARERHMAQTEEAEARRAEEKEELVDRRVCERKLVLALTTGKLIRAQAIVRGWLARLELPMYRKVRAELRREGIEAEEEQLRLLECAAEGRTWVRQFPRECADFMWHRHVHVLSQLREEHVEIWGTRFAVEARRAAEARARVRAGMESAETDGRGAVADASTLARATLWSLCGFGTHALLTTDAAERMDGLRRDVLHMGRLAAVESDEDLVRSHYLRNRCREERAEMVAVLEQKVRKTLVLRYDGEISDARSSAREALRMARMRAISIGSTPILTGSVPDSASSTTPPSAGDAPRSPLAGRAYHDLLREHHRTGDRFVEIVEIGRYPHKHHPLGGAEAPQLLRVAVFLPELVEREDMHVVVTLSAIEFFSASRATVDPPIAVVPVTWPVSEVDAVCQFSGERRLGVVTAAVKLSPAAGSTWTAAEQRALAKVEQQRQDYIDRQWPAVLSRAEADCRRDLLQECGTVAHTVWEGADQLTSQAKEHIARLDLWLAEDDERGRIVSQALAKDASTLGVGGVISRRASALKDQMTRRALWTEERRRKAEASTVLSSVWRGRTARRRVAEMVYGRKLLKWLPYIQRLWRCRSSRALAAQLRWQREERLAERDLIELLEHSAALLQATWKMSRLRGDLALADLFDADFA
eukprot:TRINITY_DN14775_c1_g1_i1.p1 TRINITY_DN14775_c1_g1~~TRINITY_DN14775_c1_g1_i1.p1  ORF type:complete len:1607 (+),score=430.77 TRINITY_DN14775_c1_g1_i1:55-4875(+)